MEEKNEMNEEEIIRKQMFLSYLKKHITENNQTIYFPYPWRLEDDKLSFRMIIRIFKLSSGSKSICIDVDHINYNTFESDDNYTTDILLHQIYTSSTENDIIINDISNFLLNFRKNYAFSKVLDKLILKKNKENEDKMNLFLFEEADPYKERICCVCNDLSLTFTKCNHNLCRVCFSSIEIENEQNECCFWKKCPMCRTKLNLYP